MVDEEWYGVPDNIEDFVGFVYIIRNKVTGKWQSGNKYESQ